MESNNDMKSDVSFVNKIISQLGYDPDVIKKVKSFEKNNVYDILGGNELNHIDDIDYLKDIKVEKLADIEYLKKKRIEFESDDKGKRHRAFYDVISKVSKLSKQLPKNKRMHMKKIRKDIGQVFNKIKSLKKCYSLY